MISINATISLLSGNDGTFSSVSSNLSNTNTSSNIEAIMGVKNETKNAFMLGVSKLDDGSQFSNSVNYYIGSQFATSQGKFQTPYQISIVGTNIKAFTIAFDTKNNRYPSSIKVNGKTYYDDDSIYTIKLDTATDNLNIIIDNWNAPNYPIVISGIYVDILIKIDRRNLKSCQTNLFDRADDRLPSYGIISNSGNITFNDFNGEIGDYAEQGLLVSGLKTSIYLTNTLTRQTKMIGQLETDTWDYDNDSKSVNVSLKDDLEEWQEINVAEISYNPKTGKEKSFYWLYYKLKSITLSYGYKMRDIDNKTYNVLTTNKLRYPLLKSDNLWRQWNKICFALRCVIYKQNGEIIFKYIG